MTAFYVGAQLHLSKMILENFLDVHCDLDMALCPNRLAIDQVLHTYIATTVLTG